MPARLIRDDMLDSERVHSVSVEGRWLFVCVMLMADDMGLFEASAFKLSRKAGISHKPCEKLLQMLADADLIRLYEVAGRTFGFIPRFRQRLQIKRAKCPLPPVELFEDDKDATSKINHLAAIPRLSNGGSRFDNGDPPLPTAGQPPEPEPEPELKEKTKTTRKRAAPAVLVSVDEMVADGVDRQNALDWLTNRKAKKLPLTPSSWSDAKAEAGKAGMTIAEAIQRSAAQGWGGFKAKWLTEDNGRNGQKPVVELWAGAK